MISVEEAKKIVVSNVSSGNVLYKSLEESINHFLSEAILSPISMPPFRQSAMDGFGIKRKEGITNYQITGEVKAGDMEMPSVESGHGVRIYTGAMVPDDVDTVVMREHARLVADTGIELEGDAEIGSNIRPEGEQINKGDIALEKGTFIDTASLSFLAMLGYDKVPVYEAPKVGIVATGSELIEPGTPLLPGQIYESNTYMLNAAVFSAIGAFASVQKVKDDFEITKETLSHTIDQSDVIIISGGISVGDYDFVGRALSELGVAPLFYKVKQKPGKPLFFGKIGEKVVFGLPGNPAAALTCFYEYVLPTLNIYRGNPQPFLRKTFESLAHDFDLKGDRSVFLKAIVEKGSVSVMSGQQSSMIRSFTEANAMIYLSGEKKSFKSGELVEVHWLPK